MKTIKKIFAVCALSGSLVAFGFNRADAISAITDVPSDFWAASAIVHTLENGYLTASGDKFYPNEAISRAKFANGVYKIINRAPSLGASKFKDVKNNESILTLNQLQVVFGYPDGNFKPEQKMKKSEATSVIANILRSELWDSSALDRYQDKNDVPAWASSSYINNIMNDVYVNYPDADYLLPNEYLTNAEAAVLLDKLTTALNSYKIAYQKGAAKGRYNINNAANAVFITKQTVEEFKYPYKTDVDLYDIKKVILAGNILPVKCTQKFNSKTIKEGEILTYISPKDVLSKEGTLLYEEGTKFVAYVDRIEHSYWFKKQDKAYIVFNKAILKDGTEFPIAGVLYTTFDGDLISAKDEASKKIAKDANKKFKKRDEAIKMTDKLVPVLKFKENGKNNSFMLVTGDMIIPASNTL